MRWLARGIALGALALASCSSSSNVDRLTVAFARVDLLDNAGNVTLSVNLVAEGDVGPSVPLVQNVPQRIRVTWFSADSTPDPSAADPSLVMKFGIPLAPYGLSFTQSPASRYQGTMTGTMVHNPLPVFVPLQLYDNASARVVFSIQAHFTVQ